MRILSLPITPALSGQTVRHLLRQELGLSSSLLKSLKWRENAILLNGRPVTVRAVAHEGDVLTVDVSDPPAETPVVPVDYPLDILCEDEDLLILNKPAGLATDADRYNSMTVTDWAALHAQGAYQPRLCHRLDYQTSGLIALAKDDMAENALKEMFARRTGRKEYQCLVLGTPQPAQADCHAFLIKDPVRAVVHVSAKALPQAKPIETEYETIQAGATSRLRVILYTGRTHQIRAHLSFLGHPIIGDDLYGDRAANREYGKGRLMLCATRLLIDTQGAMPEIDGLDIRIDPPF